MAVQARLYSENMGLLPMCGLQDWTMNPLLGSDDDVYINLREQPQQTTQVQQHRMMQSLGLNSNQGASSSSGDHNFMSKAFSQFFAAQVEKHRLEIDSFLQLQNERLRMALQEQRKQQVTILLQRLESELMSLMWQKDEDLAVATKKAMELQDCLRRAEMETEAWQRLAKENEAMVIDLNNMLKQVRERVCYFSNGAEDAVSFCDSSNRGVVGDREEGEEVKGQISKKIACKCCNSRSLCVVFLPCKHLCSCKSCEAFLDSCPICKSVKKASMEVFLV